MEKYVSTKEWMAYAVGALGQGMVYAIMSSYISDFYLSRSEEHTSELQSP